MRGYPLLTYTNAAAQPMASADGRYTLTFNGEIYNYRALRQSLEASGVAFRTRSDTEVLLHLYRREGRWLFEPVARHIRVRDLGPGREASLHCPGPSGREATLLRRTGERVSVCQRVEIAGALSRICPGISILLPFRRSSGVLVDGR